MNLACRFTKNIYFVFKVISLKPVQPLYCLVTNKLCLHTLELKKRLFVKEQVSLAGKRMMRETRVASCEFFTGVDAQHPTRCIPTLLLPLWLRKCSNIVEHLGDCSYNYFAHFKYYVCSIRFEFRIPLLSMKGTASCIIYLFHSVNVSY